MMKATSIFLGVVLMLTQSAFASDSSCEDQLRELMEAETREDFLGGDVNREMYEKSRNMKNIFASQCIFPSLRPAKTEEIEWAKKEFAKQGRHVVEDAGDYFIATHDFYLYGLYGARSIVLLWPEGIRFLGGDRGHVEMLSYPTKKECKSG